MSIDPKSGHYDVGGIETIDFIRAKLSGKQMDAFAAYCLGNTIKYGSRLLHKGLPERDAEKLSLYAMWLHEALLPPPAERQEQVRERHDFSHIPAWEPHGDCAETDGCQDDADLITRMMPAQETVRSPATMVSGRCPGNGNRDVCVHECRDTCAVNGMPIGDGEGWQRPPDRPLASHCPDGGTCREGCGLEPCKAASRAHARTHV